MKPLAIDRFMQIGLSSDSAASFIGVSRNTFAAMVKAGTMPPARVIGSRKIWDRREIEAAFAALPRDGEERVNPWDEEAA